MTRTIAAVSAIVVALAGCGSPLGQDPGLVYGAMEIHYTKAGGWIDTRRLDVFRNGRARAVLVAQASLDTLYDVSTYLTFDDRQEMAETFEGFTAYERRYVPKPWRTDGNCHTIVLRYADGPDTVAVYQPERVHLPGRLRRTIERLDKLWLDTLYPED